MPVNESDDRLFVPLKTEHYRAFEAGEKEWELRGINNQFNPEQVVKGRVVELRRGYSTDDSLWGTITDVATFDSLDVIPIQLDHTLIVPGATREEFLTGAQELLGDYDEYIAFRVGDLHYPVTSHD